MCAKNKLGLIRKCYQQNVLTNHIYSIYMHEQDLVLVDTLYNPTKPNRTV